MFFFSPFHPLLRPRRSWRCPKRRRRPSPSTSIFLDHAGKLTPLSGQQRRAADLATHTARDDGENVRCHPAVFSQDRFQRTGDVDGSTTGSGSWMTPFAGTAKVSSSTSCGTPCGPTDDEPVVFEQSIQGQLTDAEWRELLTPGTRLNERWQSQVDVIAFFLRKLRDASCLSCGGPITR